MLAIRSRNAPSCQLVPPTNTMHDAAMLPIQANHDMNSGLLELRSAIAPTIGRMIAESTVISGTR